MKAINSQFYICGPIPFPDLKEARKQGVKSLINVRPDGEQDGQLDNTAYQRWATELGLEYAYLPVAGGNYAPNDVAIFDELLRCLPTPILAVCRTGTRAMHLWALVQKSRGQTTQSIVDKGSKVGIDVRPILGLGASQAK